MHVQRQEQAVDPRVLVGLVDVLALQAEEAEDVAGQPAGPAVQEDAEVAPMLDQPAAARGGLLEPGDQRRRGVGPGGPG